MGDGVVLGVFGRSLLTGGFNRLKMMLEVELDGVDGVTVLF